MRGIGFARYIANVVFAVIPTTRMFAFKRAAWRLCGLAIAKDVRINSGGRLFGAGQVSIGKGTWVGMDCTLIVPSPARVEIGSNCDIAPMVVFECGSHEVGPAERRAGNCRADDIVVGAGVWIGARAILLGGVCIGAGSVVAAGAVVRSGEYPENSLLAGVPARVVKRLHPGN